MNFAAPLIMTFLMLMASAEGAQPVVAIRLQHTRLLQFEPVVAFVSIRNISEDMLELGPGAPPGSPRLMVHIEKQTSDFVKRRCENPPMNPLRILPDATREAMIDLSTWYDLTAMGSYTATAQVEYEGQIFTSDSVRFEIDNGLPVDQFRQVFSDPGRPARVYSLRYMGRSGYERLFLRVDEEETGINYGSFELGPLIRVKKPTISMERGGRLTVLHQTGSDRFTRSTFKVDEDGVVFVDQRYEHENGTPYESDTKAMKVSEKKPSD